MANAGFFFDFQLINVDDFNGVGESEPNPYFYQNLAEAEYVVATFMYMRMIGYPADKVSILTTYNGQKHLIRDVIQQRCADNRLIGRPHKVTTVDRYQGQQNDFILLSLVRTRAVGHLRDVRRLIVAMSRARLGLYVFARVSLFQNCFELTPAFNQLMVRPQQLFLAPAESYPPNRKAEQKPTGDPLILRDMPHMAQFVFDFYQHKLRQLAAQQAPSAAPVSARAETWRPGAAAVESVRHQARYDQSHVEEHPAAEETDDEDESSEEQRQSAASAESGSDVTMTTSDAAADRTSSDVTGGDGATEESMEEES